MKVLLASLAVVCLAQWASAAPKSSCSGAKLKTYYDCMKSSFGGGDDQKKPDHGGNSHGADMAACFTESGCKAPTMGGGDHKADEKPAGAKDCMMAVMKASQTKMEACMKSKYPDADISAMSAEMHGKMGGMHGGMGGGMHGGMGGGDHGGQHDGAKAGDKADKWMDEACGTTGNKAKLQECLKSKVPQGGQKPDMKAAFDTMCKTKATCDAGFGKDCVAQLQKDMCDCQSQAEAEKDSAMQKTASCAGMPTGQGKKPASDCSKAGDDFCTKATGGH